jgi:hypothetical protein
MGMLHALIVIVFMIELILKFMSLLGIYKQLVLGNAYVHKEFLLMKDKDWVIQ